MNAVIAIIRRDLLLAMRRKSEVLTALFFFIIVVSLFPLGIGPETALLRSTDGLKLQLLEQNFDFDLLTPKKLLEKSVGEVVRVVRTLEAESEPSDPTIGSPLAHEVVWPLWEDLRAGMMAQLDTITIDALCQRARAKGLGTVQATGSRQAQPLAL